MLVRGPSSAGLLLLFLLLGCKASSGPGTAPADGVASAERMCGSTPAEDGFIDVVPSNPGIRYIGRLDDTDRDAPKLAFPAVTLETRFEGDAIDIRLREEAPGGPTRTAHYAVSIDGGSPSSLVTCSRQEVYPLARGLSAGTHTIRISKRTEAQVGTATFLGFRVRPGTTLRPPVAPSRRLEFVGDSITCGYGNELSTSDPDRFPFTSANENALLAYGAIAARSLRADYVAVAYSGRGLVRNYGGLPGLPAPEFYELAAPSPGAPRWDHARYSPDVIVINLGTNDFSVGLNPDELGAMRARYRQAYAELLKRLRGYHPLATLIAAVGPMMNDGYPPGYQALTRVRADVSGAVNARAAEGDANVRYFEFEPQVGPYGEDWHPTVATHRRMAEAISTFIRETKGW